MPKFKWTAIVTQSGRNPGHGNGTVEAATPAQAKDLVKDYVNKSDDGLAFARDIKLTPDN